MERNWGSFDRKAHSNNAEGYKYFTKNELHDIFVFCRELTKYLEQEKVKNVLFLDRSARPAWIGVDEYWNQHYKDEPKPGFYFANPSGMDISSGEGEVIDDPRQILMLFATLLKTGNLPEEEGKEKALEELAVRFKNVFPKLVQDLNEPLVVFDTCAHTGETMNVTIDLLDKVGFTDVRPITANEPDWDSVVPATVIDDEVRLTSCYPFGRHSLVSKTDDIIAAPNRANLEMGTRIREDIRQVMRTEKFEA